MPVFRSPIQHSHSIAFCLSLSCVLLFFTAIVRAEETVQDQQLPAQVPISGPSLIDSTEERNGGGTTDTREASEGIGGRNGYESESAEAGNFEFVSEPEQPAICEYHYERDELDIPLRANFGEGFGFESLDRQFQLRMRILNQVDAKLNLPQNQEPARDGLYIPRFRVGFEGQVTDLVKYEMTMQRSVEGAFDLLDANANLHFSDAFQFRVGRGLSPYSFAWYDHLEQYYITPERGLYALNFGLARQSSLMLHGNLNEKQFEYAVSASYGQLAGLADTNSTREGIGYINFLPFLHSRSRSYLRYLNLGGSLAIGRQPFAEGRLPLRTSLQSSENDEAAAAASSVFLEFNDDVVSRGKRLQGALHASLYAGPISVEAEWYAAEINIAPDAMSSTTPVDITGYDVTVASFLTGERITERSQVAPLRPFTGWGRGGRGALEVFGRYSELSLSDNVFTDGLAEESVWTNRVSMIDVGFNWYLNRSFRITCDWQHVMYGSPVLLNEEEDLRRSSNNLLWTRFQLYF